MNIFKFFVTAIMIGSTITISAANKTEDSTQQPNPEQVYYQWEGLFDKCVKKYEAYIDSAKSNEKMHKKLKMTEDDFNNYKNLCSKLDSSITLMNNKNDFNSTVDFDINKWDSLSCIFKDVIKSNIKDELGEDNDKTWEKKCSALKDYYSKLTTDYKEAKYFYAEKLINENNNQKNKISQLKAQNDSLTKNLKGVESELNKFKTDKTNFGNGLQKAFEVCVFFPLAVKYNKEYVDYAHLAAKEIIESGKGNIVPAMINDWKKFEPLLLNYGKYNDAFIKYVEKQKTTLVAKKIITVDEVDFYKKAIEHTNDYPILKEYFTKYYKNKNVNIQYLNNAIDEYFNILNDYAGKGKEIKANVFDNFISIHLK